jgi:hypothetical protein
MNEFIFILVGALLVLFALTGCYLLNPRLVNPCLGAASEVGGTLPS